MGRDVIIACDFAGSDETLNFLSQFKEEKPFIKIGMELFYAEGPQIVKELKKRFESKDKVYSYAKKKDKQKDQRLGLV